MPPHLRLEIHLCIPYPKFSKLTELKTNIYLSEIHVKIKSNAALISQLVHLYTMDNTKTCIV